MPGASSTLSKMPAAETIFSAKFRRCSCRQRPGRCLAVSALLSLFRTIPQPGHKAMDRILFPRVPLLASRSGRNTADADHHEYSRVALLRPDDSLARLSLNYQFRAAIDLAHGIKRVSIESHHSFRLRPIAGLDVPRFSAGARAHRDCGRRPPAPIGDICGNPAVRDILLFRRAQCVVVGHPTRDGRGRYRADRWKFFLFGAPLHI